MSQNANTFEVKDDVLCTCDGHHKTKVKFPRQDPSTRLSMELTTEVSMMNMTYVR